MRLLRGRVTRLEDLIDGILAYSRAGREQGEPIDVDIGAARARGRGSCSRRRRRARLDDRARAADAARRSASRCSRC